MESIDSRLVAMERASKTRVSKEQTVDKEERESMEKMAKKLVWPEEMVTRQTKVKFPSFDGTSIQEWLFRSERFFEIYETPP